jgi:hypothetical protein
MPKLASKMAKAAAEAEDVVDGFEPLPAGKYIATLKEVEDRIAQSTGAKMWGIELEEITDLEGNVQPGRQFTNLVLPGEDKMPADYQGKDNSRKTLEEQWKSRNDFLRGKLKQFFEAFGYTTDSDTDEMIGDRAVIALSVETIGAGKRKGQLGNQVTGFYTLDSVDFEDAAATGDGDDDF